MKTSARLQWARERRADAEKRGVIHEWDSVIERAELEEAAGFDGEEEDFKAFIVDLVAVAKLAARWSHGDSALSINLYPLLRKLKPMIKNSYEYNR